MSFRFHWPKFSEEIYEHVRDVLTNALNRGEMPSVISGPIHVKEINLGTIPPELDILEVGDLSKDRFKGIFRLTYHGDAFIVLETTIQANPLTPTVHRTPVEALRRPKTIHAASSLRVPMLMRLSDVQLQAIIVLVVSRHRGVTLVFKNDPLQHVSVSSSFDNVDMIAGFIQRQIELTLREALRSDLPGLIYKMSQDWLKKRTHDDVDSPYAQSQAPHPPHAHLHPPHSDLSSTTSTAPSQPPASSSSTAAPGDASLDWDSMSISSGISASSQATVKPRIQADFLHADSSVPESIESFDPTYGLRSSISLGSQPLFSVISPLASRRKQYSQRVASTASDAASASVPSVGTGMSSSRGLGDVLLDEHDSRASSYDDDVDSFASKIRSSASRVASRSANTDAPDPDADYMENYFTFKSPRGPTRPVPASQLGHPPPAHHALPSHLSQASSLTPGLGMQLPLDQSSISALPWIPRQKSSASTAASTTHEPQSSRSSVVRPRILHTQAPLLHTEAPLDSHHNAAPSESAQSPSDALSASFTMNDGTSARLATLSSANQTLSPFAHYPSHVATRCSPQVRLTKREPKPSRQRPVCRRVWRLS